ncbi:MAG: non-homologous end-joining DNA ligase [Candidatus Aenigmarchaeota archaeon]|nr:non-homologous end-joining DNA ligase [Candidatus Aenigmarchaeota archaeon]
MTLWDELIKPMLAYPSKPFDSPDWVFEIKFDGTRSIAYVDVKNRTVRFLNRRMMFFEHRYPELGNIFEDMDADRIILDGEIVVFDENGRPDFFKLAEREHVDDKLRVEILSEQNPATYIVFDVLHIDGNDLIDLPWEKRREILENRVKESDRMLISKYVRESGTKLFEEIKKLGMEGIMAKRIDSPYLIGKRSKLWLKIKALKTLDVAICGYTTGKGVRKELLGSLITGVYVNGKLKYTGKVGTGFDEEEMKKLKSMLDKLIVDECPFEEVPQLDLPSGRYAVWTKPELVCEVKFLELTRDGIMRAPSYVRLRTDKLPEDCILEA